MKVEGEEPEKPPPVDKSLPSKCFFMRPQDKWASSGDSAANSSPEKPKGSISFYSSLEFFVVSASL